MLLTVIVFVVLKSVPGNPTNYYCGLADYPRKYLWWPLKAIMTYSPQHLHDFSHTVKAVHEHHKSKCVNSVGGAANFNNVTKSCMSSRDWISTQSACAIHKIVVLLFVCLVVQHDSFSKKKKKKKIKKALRRSLVPGWNLFLFTKLITYAGLLQSQICFPWNRTTSRNSQVTPVRLRNDPLSPLTENIYDLRCSCILWFFSAFKIDSQVS